MRLKARVRLRITTRKQQGVCGSWSFPLSFSSLDSSWPDTVCGEVRLTPDYRGIADGQVAKGALVRGVLKLPSVGVNPGIGRMLWAGSGLECVGSGGRASGFGNRSSDSQGLGLCSGLRPGSDGRGVRRSMDCAEAREPKPEA